MRRLNLIKHLAVCLTLSAPLQAKLVTQRCWGGEGPRPFIDMGGLISADKTIVTSGDVAEYVFWENKNTVVYRNLDGWIWRKNLSTGEHRRLDQSTTELARVADPRNRFIYTLGLNFVLDALTGKWSPFAPKVMGQVKELFHQVNELFFVSEHSVRGRQRFDFYSNSSGKRPLCSWQVSDGRSYKLGYGHKFPYVYLHTTDKIWSDHSILRVQKFDVTKCDVTEEYDYSPLPLEGNVIDVFRYDANHQDAVAVTTDHQTKNLLWDDGKSCQFYEIPSSTVVPIRSEIPVFAVWAQQDGLSMLRINASGGKRAAVMSTEDLLTIDATDFWLTVDGRRLFFTPQYAGTYRRPLLEILF